MVTNGNANLLSFIEPELEPFPVVPATSAYESLCLQIATDLERTTPPDDADIGYLRNDDEEIDPGESSDRLFRFEYQTATAVGFQGTYIRLREETLLIVFIKGARHNVKTIDEALRNEGLLIKMQINFRETWPDGVSHVNAKQFQIRNRGIDDVEIVIPITFESQNSQPMFADVIG